VTVNILAPSSTTATLDPDFHNLGGRSYASPAAQCSAFERNAPCRGDFWKPIVFIGDAAMNLQSLQQNEDQSDNRPLTYLGTRLPICPFETVTVSTTPSAPFANHGNTGQDAMYYSWPDTPFFNLAFRNCGDSSTQGFTFISSYSQSGGTESHACTFITGISKTKHLFQNQNICTTRSDGISICP
jgi:hypothetical protein